MATAKTSGVGMVCVGDTVCTMDDCAYYAAYVTDVDYASGALRVRIVASVAKEDASPGCKNVTVGTSLTIYGTDLIPVSEYPGTPGDIKEEPEHVPVSDEEEKRIEAALHTGLPTEAAARKAIPVYTGFMKYFPRAMAAVAELSRIGNDQHNPGKPLHWDRSKSGDELDACMRHLLEAGEIDTDGVRHSTKGAWRAMANLEKELERAESCK